MKPKWHLRDLIDLEYFLQADDAADDGEVVHRDREIYLKEVLPVLENDRAPDVGDRRTIIRLWLESRRRLMKSTEDEAVLPGRLFVDIYRLLLLISLVMAAIIGIGLAFAFLDYKGVEPVNVSTYFGVFVISQIFLIGAFLAFSLVRQWIRSLRRISLLHALLGVFLAGVFRKVVMRAMKTLSAEKRNRIAAMEGIVKGKKRVYGTVFFWPVFILAQVIGIGFNLGVLAGSVLRILSLDLAFGWQSTVQFSSNAVYMFVKTIALPWSWIVPSSMAYPTYEQIEGSRMVLKDGIYHLFTPDLVSWWPFLLLAVLCYGFLPRIILLGTGIIAGKRAADGLNFNHAACSSLLRRMNTPVLDTDSLVAADGDRFSPSEDAPVSAGQPKDRGSAAAGHWDEAIVLVPDDIFEQSTPESLKGWLNKALGMNLKQQIKIALDFEEDKHALAGVVGDMTPVVMLQEAWQPPIAETMSYLRKLRELVGTEVPVHILLVGKPASENVFTHTGTSDWHIWKQAIQMLGDPFIDIHGLRAREKIN